MAATGPLARIESVNVGTPRPLAGAPGRPLSAIAKSPVRGPVPVRATNLAGDAQADTRHHGGPDKAVHAHFAAHLEWWGRLRGRPVSPGEIGENLTLASASGGDPPSETRFFIGDVVAAGTAILQVTQPRVPCFKQAAALGIPDAVRLAAAAGRTGIYLRVLREGVVKAGDELTLIARPNPGVCVADANDFIHRARDDDALRARLRACTGLGTELRRRLGG